MLFLNRKRYGKVIFAGWDIIKYYLLVVTIITLIFFVIVIIFNFYQLFWSYTDLLFLIVLDQYYLQSIGQLTRQTYTLSLVIGVVYTTGYEAGIMWETEGITWFHKAWGNLIETSNTSVVMTV